MSQVLTAGVLCVVLAVVFDLVIVAAVPEAPASGLIDVPEDQAERLVAQSLVMVEQRAEGTRYHLLRTTRAYALEKLRGSGQWQLVHRRYALQQALQVRRSRPEAPRRA